MEDQRDQLESLCARSGFKDYSHGIGKIYGGIFRSWSSYLVKKLRWIFRRRMRTSPKCLAWDVADLFCSRLVSINTAKTQVRIGYEAGKCHHRHVTVAFGSPCWHYVWLSILFCRAFPRSFCTCPHRLPFQFSALPVSKESYLPICSICRILHWAN